MRTASSKATTTRIGNSRQNDRFLRPRRVAGLRPPEAVLPSDTASAALSSSAAGPLAWAVLLVSAWAWSGTLASGALASGVSAPLSALDARARSGSPGAALSSRPASGSAPGVTPRPAPLIRAPSETRPLVGVHRHRFELSAKSWLQDRQPASSR